MSSTVTCSLCTAAAEKPVVNGVLRDLPLWWSTVMIAEMGGRVRHFTLCRPCTTGVRSAMAQFSSQHRDSLAGRHAAVNG